MNDWMLVRIRETTWSKNQTMKTTRKRAICSTKQNLLNGSGISPACPKNEGRRGELLAAVSLGFTTSNTNQPLNNK